MTSIQNKRASLIQEVDHFCLLTEDGAYRKRNLAQFAMHLRITSHYASSYSTFNSLRFLCTFSVCSGNSTSGCRFLPMWCCTLVWGTVSVRVCVYNNHFPQLLQQKEKSCWRQLSFQAAHLLGMRKKMYKKSTKPHR